jgi:Na+-driven multidrug efflux pump
MGTKVLIGVLLALAVLSGITAFVGWNSAPESQMSGHGYAAMAIGIVMSLAVGIGLMGLVFYSNRKGYDDAAARDQRTHQEDV